MEELLGGSEEQLMTKEFFDHINMIVSEFLENEDLELHENVCVVVKLKLKHQKMKTQENSLLERDERRSQENNENSIS
jgi:hypothetical protein